MADHTPGPWTKGKNRTENCILSNGLVVANVNHYPLDPEQSAANLALIAAAPDLLIALEECLAAQRDYLLATTLQPGEAQDLAIQAAHLKLNKSALAAILATQKARQ